MGQHVKPTNRVMESRNQLGLITFKKTIIYINIWKKKKKDDSEIEHQHTNNNIFLWNNVNLIENKIKQIMKLNY